MKLWIIEYYRFLRVFKHPHDWAIRQTSKILSLVSKSEFSNIDNDSEHIGEFIDYFFKETDFSSRLLLINRQPTLNKKWGIIQ